MSSTPVRSSFGSVKWAAAAVPVMLVCFLAGKYGTNHGSVNVAPAVVNASSLPDNSAGQAQKRDVGYSSADAGQQHSSAGMLKLDPGKQQSAGITLAVVQRESGSIQRQFSGTVAPDDSRIYRVTLGVDGWIRQTFDASIGSHVKAGEPLAAFWSPELTAALNSYLVASDRSSVAVKQASVGLDNASLRLRNLGVGEEQIKRIGETRKLPDSVDIVSPADGFIISRNVSAGSKFEMGTEFYRIADLSHVWIVANFNESEAQGFRPGTEAIVTLNQGKVLHARVTDALPQFNSASQTMKLRLEAPNPGFELRPGMLVDVQIPESLPKGLTVPAESVIDSGATKRVFVHRGDGLFEPREVETGWRLGNRIQIVSGLNAGEEVVAAGAFLVDSEARLKSIAAAIPTSR